MTSRSGGVTSASLTLLFCLLATVSLATDFDTIRLLKRAEKRIKSEIEYDGDRTRNAIRNGGLTPLRSLVTAEVNCHCVDDAGFCIRVSLSGPNVVTKAIDLQALIDVQETVSSFYENLNITGFEQNGIQSRHVAMARGAVVVRQSRGVTSSVSTVSDFITFHDQQGRRTSHPEFGSGTTWAIGTPSGDVPIGWSDIRSFYRDLEQRLIADPITTQLSTANGASQVIEITLTPDPAAMIPLLSGGRMVDPTDYVYEVGGVLASIESTPMDMTRTSWVSSGNEFFRNALGPKGGDRCFGKTELSVPVGGPILSSENTGDYTYFHFGLTRRAAITPTAAPTTPPAPTPAGPLALSTFLLDILLNGTVSAPSNYQYAEHKCRQIFGSSMDVPLGGLDRRSAPMNVYVVTPSLNATNGQKQLIHAAILDCLMINDPASQSRAYWDSETPSNTVTNTLASYTSEFRYITPGATLGPEVGENFPSGLYQPTTDPFDNGLGVTVTLAANPRFSDFASRHNVVDDISPIMGATYYS